MKLSSALASLALVSTASAFAPVVHQQPRVSVALEAEKGRKRQIAWKVAKRAGGALATIGLATAVAPGAAFAKKAAKASKSVQTLSLTAEQTKAAVFFVGGSFSALFLSNLLSPGDLSITAAKIGSVFPGALKNKDLVDKVSSSLEKYGYGRDSLLATSLCADEVNRCLEKDFSDVYGDNFSMGGLAGLPFGGVTSFGAMAAHIPDGGSCLIVFGPHVGVDSNGTVGSVERRGRSSGGSCCGSAVAASGYVAAVNSGDTKKAPAPTVPTDAQQEYVGNMLLPYATRLEKASEKMVELPYALYDAQKKMMGDIIKAGAGNVAGNGKIAVLGGIQVNTPESESDYFKPMSFEIYDNNGKLLEDMSSKL